MLDNGGQVGCAAVVEVRRVLPERAKRSRPIFSCGAPGGIDRFGSSLCWLVQKRNCCVGIAQHVGVCWAGMSGSASRLVAEQLPAAVRSLSIEAALSGSWRAQALLIVQQGAQLGCHQIGRLIDEQADACVFEAAVPAHLRYADIPVPVRDWSVE